MKYELTTYQQKIVDYLVAHKDKNVIFYWTRQAGRTHVMKEVQRRLKDE